MENTSRNTDETIETGRVPDSVLETLSLFQGRRVYVETVSAETARSLGRENEYIVYTERDQGYSASAKGTIYFASDGFELVNHRRRVILCGPVKAIAFLKDVKSGSTWRPGYGE